MGQSPESSSYNENGEGIPFFQGNADFGVLHPTARVWCNAPTKTANAGDVLISVRAPIGDLNMADQHCCIGRGLAALTVNQKLCVQKYLWYGLKSKINELNSKGTGSTFKAINKATLEETELSLPPLDEQRRIAAVLDKVSDLIAKRRAQLDKLDELVKAQFVEMFGDPERNPKHWPVLSMNQTCKVGSSKRIYKSEHTSNGIPFLRVSNLTDLINTGMSTPDLYIPEELYNELKNQGQVPTAGDILLTSRGTLGQCYIVKENDEFYFQDGMISWLSNFSDCITPLYLSYLFAMPGFRRQIESIQAGTTVSYLSISMINRLSVMLPTMELQISFSSFVKHTEGMKLTIQQSLDKLEMLKKTLMQGYFG